MNFLEEERMERDDRSWFRRELLDGSASASARADRRWKYDVFLSFRGEDTRKGFTDHLYDKLQWRAIKTFKDDQALERGTLISPELRSAIQESQFAIVVLSPNYASSTWCLSELAMIFQCMTKRGTILPIFYNVDPSDVRHQRGTFAEAFAKHEKDITDIRKWKLDRWRADLTDVSNLAGWTSNDRYETELIEEVVEVVWRKVHPTYTLSGSTENIVGIDSRLNYLDMLLSFHANDVRFIGIWGMGGMGKTTLARLVYERISHEFQVSSFLANIRERSSKYGLAHLQDQLLSLILKEKTTQVWDVYSGSAMTKNLLSNKKVLLILDDVDELNQLEILAGKTDWFGPGSRIIVTTRNERLLIEHGMYKRYEVLGLNDDQALHLFSLKALKTDRPDDDYVELSKCFVNYAKGHPLALTILGSSLYKRGKDAWSSALDKLKKAPNATIFQTLKISYDGLDEMEKRVFLDVACFHTGNDKERVIEILENCGFCARIVVDVLIEKSLLTIMDGYVMMHDLTQEMGWEIVRQESFEEPGRRSRLWLYKDIFHVFMRNTGTEAIEGIVLRLPELEQAQWNPESFSKISRLKFLQLHNLNLSVGPKYLSSALRVLDWSWYPSKSLPPTFQPNELSELSLHHSKIDRLWSGIKVRDLIKPIAHFFVYLCFQANDYVTFYVLYSTCPA
ncbi:disease resistance protein RUN1-like [Malus sylvestris]|uniref:disease resistance protein RUN1-like n=1 Tax=Malus sylvestris TaxID=3752 RepID=UPI0021AC9799|nr:disease resistance protein RUN1-like [Malus sylvestris]